MYLYSSHYAMIFVRSHICREENTQPGLKIYRLAWPSFLFQWVSAFSLCLYSYSTSFSLLRFFPAIFPSFLLHPSLFSDLSPHFYSSSYLCTKWKIEKEKNTPAQSCWVILCGRRNVDDRTIFTSLLNEFSFSPSLCFSHTSFLASPHSLNLYLLHSSASSFTPFAFSVSRDVSLPSLNSPATL